MPRWRWGRYRDDVAPRDASGRIEPEPVPPPLFDVDEEVAFDPPTVAADLPPIPAQAFEPPPLPPLPPFQAPPVDVVPEPPTPEPGLSFEPHPLAADVAVPPWAAFDLSPSPDGSDLERADEFVDAPDTVWPAESTGSEVFLSPTDDDDVDAALRAELDDLRERLIQADGRQTRWSEFRSKLLVEVRRADAGINELVDRLDRAEEAAARAGALEDECAALRRQLELASVDPGVLARVVAERDELSRQLDEARREIERLHQAPAMTPDDVATAEARAARRHGELLKGLSGLTAELGLVRTMAEATDRRVADELATRVAATVADRVGDRVLAVLRPPSLPSAEGPTPTASVVPTTPIPVVVRPPSLDLGARRMLNRVGALRREVEALEASGDRDAAARLADELERLAGDLANLATQV